MEAFGTSSFTPWVQIQTFYNGLVSQTKSIVDAAAAGSIMTKTYEEAYELMEKLASNHHQKVYDKTARKPTPEVLQMDVFTTLSAQLSALTKQMQILKNQAQARAKFGHAMHCGWCGGAHTID